MLEEIINVITKNSNVDEEDLSDVDTLESLVMYFKSLNSNIVFAVKSMVNSFRNKSVPSGDEKQEQGETDDEISARLYNIQATASKKDFDKLVDELVSHKYVSLTDESPSEYKRNLKKKTGFQKLFDSAAGYKPFYRYQPVFIKRSNGDFIVTYRDKPFLQGFGTNTPLILHEDFYDEVFEFVKNTKNLTSGRERQEFFRDFNKLFFGSAENYKQNLENRIQQFINTMGQEFNNEISAQQLIPNIWYTPEGVGPRFQTSIYLPDVDSLDELNFKNGTLSEAEIEKAITGFHNIGSGVVTVRAKRLKRIFTCEDADVNEEFRDVSQKLSDLEGLDFSEPNALQKLKNLINELLDEIDELIEALEESDLTEALPFDPDELREQKENTEELKEWAEDNNPGNSSVTNEDFLDEVKEKLGDFIYNANRDLGKSTTTVARGLGRIAPTQAICCPDTLKLAKHISGEQKDELLESMGADPDDNAVVVEGSGVPGSTDFAMGSGVETACNDSSIDCAEDMIEMVEDNDDYNDLDDIPQEEYPECYRQEEEIKTRDDIL